MKILFTADLHINLTKKNVPKDWEKSRYNKLFDHLEELESESDITVIGGDIFDKLPNTEEIEMYFNMVSRFKKPVFLYDGNHEATKKGQTFMHHLSSSTSLVNNNATIITEPCEIHHIDFIPYTHIKTFNPKDFHNKILCTHVRGNIEPHVKAEIDLEKFSRWEVVLAGDLHAHSNSQQNILYPGSPLSISFHRNKIKNGVLIFDTDKMEYTWIELLLPQLIRKTVEDESDIVKTSYDHTIYELVGSIDNLSDIKIDKSLLDKKLLDKDYSSKLALEGKTLEEELDLYLDKILKIEKPEREQIMRVFHDNI